MTAGPAQTADDQLRTELQQYVIETYYAMDRQLRPDCHWVMSPQWWLDCCRLLNLEPSMAPGEPDYLVGLPVQVHAGAGAPRLIRSHPGDWVAARKY
jgi:hypothetical protein